MPDARATPTSWLEGLRVDLGCGEAKEDGFVGVDRYPGAKVDVVSDLDDVLPFETSSVDHVRLSHSLEHVRDVPAFMSEVYRILKDRGLVTVIAPYGETTLDLSNPYHLNAITEQTARFLTDTPSSALPSEWYRFPFSEPWGLQSSDNGTRQYDFRLIGCEFMPFSDVRVDENRLWELRRLLRNVVHEVVLQLVAAKTELPPAEEAALAALDGLPEPAYLAAHRHAPLVEPSPLLRAVETLPEQLQSLALAQSQGERTAAVLDDRLLQLELQADARSADLEVQIRELAAEVAALRSEMDAAASSAAERRRSRTRGRIDRSGAARAMIAKGVYRPRQDLASMLSDEYDDLVEAAVLSTPTSRALSVVGTPAMPVGMVGFDLPDMRSQGELFVGLMADAPPERAMLLGSWDVVARTDGVEAVVASGPLLVGPEVNVGPVHLGFAAVSGDGPRLRLLLTEAAAARGLRALVVAQMGRTHARGTVVLAALR